MDSLHLAEHKQTSALVVTAIATFLTGYVFGIYTNRGYLISPDLANERHRNFNDPVESDESDIDEDDTILDHAPNWANGKEADAKQGLRASSAAARPAKDNGEECKLVLVVRTDLGMTKGTLIYLLRGREENVTAGD